MNDICCMIVPDSRLWTPSAQTVALLQQESFASSVVFEEWLELCCQRCYIVPPSYTRMVMIAEYLRISCGSEGYLAHIRNSALLPFEERIPMTSNTDLLRTHAFIMDVNQLFSVTPVDWLNESGGVVKRLLGHVDDSLTSLYLSALALGSPYQDFTKDDWCAYNLAEIKLLRGSHNLYRKLHGYWPSHPFHDYNTRGMGRMCNTSDSIEERRVVWISDLYSVMQEQGTAPGIGLLSTDLSIKTYKRAHCLIEASLHLTVPSSIGSQRKMEQSSLVSYQWPIYLFKA